MALNLIIVMFLGGLWHGAAWTFVDWGLLHGFYLVIERFLRTLFENKSWASRPSTRVLAGFATYGAVCIAWVFFRASDFTVASRMLTGMFGGHPYGDAILSTRELLQIGMVTAGVIAMHWAMRDDSFETSVMRLPAWTIAAIGSGMACAIVFTQGTSNAFIYFQF
jgi:D-alanyl-lipoteichoic acid acyltransferase DltB (MBOAT superfamily)